MGLNVDGTGAKWSAVHDFRVFVDGRYVRLVRLLEWSGETFEYMDRYVCIICGYVYDPAEGDPESGIAPGTAFEDIPDDWLCPVCGVGKEHFEKTP